MHPSPLNSPSSSQCDYDCPGCDKNSVKGPGSWGGDHACHHWLGGTREQKRPGQTIPEDGVLTMRHDATTHAAHAKRMLHMLAHAKHMLNSHMQSQTHWPTRSLSLSHILAISLTTHLALCSPIYYSHADMRAAPQKQSRCCVALASLSRGEWGATASSEIIFGGRG